MAQNLPFFKNYPIDWIMSEKVACMTLHEIGAYKLLTDHQWIGTACTLPDDPVRLKILVKWNDETHGDFSRVLACFPKLRTPNGRRGNPRLLEEYAEATARQALAVEHGQQGAQKRWADKPKRVSKVVRDAIAKDQHADWLVSLKLNPAYKHLNIDHELAKMDAWLSTRPARKKTKRFVVNWLNRIEPPLTNGHGTTSRPPPPPPKNDPIGRGLWGKTYGRPEDHGYI